MASLLRDLHFAARLLRRTPGFTIFSVLTLAAAIGACTAMYSIVHGLILEPLPYPKPTQIVQILQVDRFGRPGSNFSDPNFEDLRDQTTSFQAMAEFNQYGFSSIVVGNVPMRVRVANVSRRFFDVMATEPMLGRRFADEESREGGALVVIVSQQFWREHFARTSDLSTARLKLNGLMHSVVGVMPAGFAFPPDVDVWKPREATNRNPYRTSHNWRVIARIRDDVTLAAARAEASAVAKRLKAQFGQDTMMSDAAVMPLHDEMVGNVRPALLILLASVGLLLLVGCANLANVLLARATARRRELAVRAAMGATNLEVILPLIAESLIVSTCGGAIGIALAAAVVQSTSLVDAADLPHVAEIHLSWPVLLFAIGLTWLTGLTLSLLAAWRERRPDLVSSLRDARGNTAGGSVGRLRNVLVVAQLVVSVVLLVGAGLLGRSLLAMLRERLGFRTTDIVAIELMTPAPRVQISRGLLRLDDPSALPRQARLNQQIIDDLAGVPGVIDVGGSSTMPLTGGGPNGTFLVLPPNDPRANIRSFDELVPLLKDPSINGRAEFRIASAGYFRVMGIPLLRGRLFDPRDSADAPHVALISDTLARTRWPNQEPIGQHVQFGGMDGDLRMFTIIGVVGDVREGGFDRPPQPVFYADFRQRPIQAFGFTFVVRTAAASATVIADARRVIRDLAPEVPPQFRTIEQIVDRSVAGRRFTAILAVVFAGAALLVAVLGIYGVTAFLVAARTQEFGLRVALGAQSRDVHRLVLGQAGRLITIGVSGGLLVAYAASHVLTSQLFGIRATDPLTYVAAAALLAIVAIVACEVPALRAMRVDPARVLRADG
jgi:putative ABC transport system permease protein